MVIATKKNKNYIGIELDDNNVIFILKIISACPALLPPLDGRADQALLLDEAEHAVHRHLSRGRPSTALVVREVVVAAAEEGSWPSVPVEVDGGLSCPSSSGGTLTGDTVDAALILLGSAGKSGKTGIDTIVVKPAEASHQRRDSADMDVQRLAMDSPLMDTSW